MKASTETNFRLIEAYLNSIAEKLYSRLIQAAFTEKADLPLVSVREMRERIRRAVTGFCDYILGACTLKYRQMSLERPIHFRVEKQSEARIAGKWSPKGTAIDLFDLALHQAKIKANLDDRAAWLFARIFVAELFGGSIVLPPLPRTDESTDRLLVLQYVEPTVSSLAESIAVTRSAYR